MVYGDNVVRKQEVEPDNKQCKIARNFDVCTGDRFRTYKGVYPREGYTSGETNPFNTPKVERKAPPLRGC